MKKMKLILMFLLISTLSFSSWTTHNFVDSFGDATSKKYVNSAVIEGVAKNSANTNIKLFAEIIISGGSGNPSVGIFLKTYNRNSPYERVRSSDTFKARNEKGEYFNTGLGEWSKNGGHKLWSDNESMRGTGSKTFVDFLKRSETVRVVIEDTRGPRAYSFTIDAMGVTKALSEIGI